VKATVVDTGPLVAFLSRRDRYHDWAVGAFASVSPPLLTCEAVLSEAVFLLAGSDRVLELVQRGVVQVPFRLDAEVGMVRTLLKRYQDHRMDLADACIVRMTEIHDDSVVMTLDSEFRDVFRRRGRQAIPTIMPPARGRARQSRPVR
jgi:predicted nucleic acid-binding protein